MSWTVGIIDWLVGDGGDESLDMRPTAEGREAARTPSRQYAACRQALDFSRNTLTAEEYNHIAAVNVRMMQQDVEHLEHLRNRQDKMERQQTRGSTGFDVHDWLASILAPCPPPCTVHNDAECPSELEVDVRTPASVMLDGSSAAALAAAAPKLSPEEYAHILDVQRRLAELELEDQLLQAVKQRPRKVPKYRDTQPNRPNQALDYLPSNAKSTKSESNMIPTTLKDIGIHGVHGVKDTPVTFPNALTDNYASPNDVDSHVPVTPPGSSYDDLFGFRRK